MGRIQRVVGLFRLFEASRRGDLVNGNVEEGGCHHGMKGEDAIDDGLGRSFWINKSRGILLFIRSTASLSLRETLSSSALSSAAFTITTDCNRNKIRCRHRLATMIRLGHVPSGAVRYRSSSSAETLSSRDRSSRDPDRSSIGQARWGRSATTARTYPSTIRTALPLPPP